MTETRSRAERHADYVQAGRSYESASDRLADRMELMMDYDAEERCFDALVAEQRERQQAMRKIRCPRRMTYQVAPDLPIGPVGAASAPIAVRTVEVQCEREHGHAGNCVGRQYDGKMFAVSGSRP